MAAAVPTTPMAASSPAGTRTRGSLLKTREGLSSAPLPSGLSHAALASRASFGGSFAAKSALSKAASAAPPRSHAPWIPLRCNASAATETAAPAEEKFTYQAEVRALAILVYFTELNPGLLLSGMAHQSKEGLTGRRKA